MRRDTPTQPPKVAIFERPASADRPRRRWLLTWVLLLAGAVVLMTYFVWMR
jgi:type VI protein secretion system component VasF